MSKKEFVFLAIAISSLILSGVALGFSYSNQAEKTTSNKMGFVELDKVFNDFNMKKELQKELEMDLAKKNKVLDSLMFDLQQLNTLLKESEKPSEEDIIKFQKKQNSYVRQKQLVEEYSSNQTAIFDNQILTQMQQYIKDFGLQNGYQIIIGSNNNGVVLYGDEMIDITQPVLEFINKAYSGKN